jgi:predicted ArsR family transcriptional regulator
MPRHDGLSAMVLEAMAHGRYVIYNHNCPFTSFAWDFDSARKGLEEILNKQAPNSEGADYVKKNFSIDAEAHRLRELMGNTFGI